MIVTLIGMRGTGKSSVGREIASQLQWEFVDSDMAIVESAKQTIAEIFASQGEPAFRELEEQVLDSILQTESNVVIASGGGAVLSGRTRSRMIAAGPVVWLTAPVGLMQQRVAQDDGTGEQRPSLLGQDVLDELSQVLRARRSLYQQVATITVPTERGTPAEIATDVVGRLRCELGEEHIERVSEANEETNVDASARRS